MSHRAVEAMRRVNYLAKPCLEFVGYDLLTARKEAQEDVSFELADVRSNQVQKKRKIAD